MSNENFNIARQDYNFRCSSENTFRRICMYRQERSPGNNKFNLIACDSFNTRNAFSWNIQISGITIMNISDLPFQDVYSITKSFLYIPVRKHQMTELGFPKIAQRWSLIIYRLPIIIPKKPYRICKPKVKATTQTTTKQNQASFNG